MVRRKGPHASAPHVSHDCGPAQCRAETPAGQHIFSEPKVGMDIIGQGKSRAVGDRYIGEARGEGSELGWGGTGRRFSSGMRR